MATTPPTLETRWTASDAPRAVAVLAHGAGAGMDHPFIAGAAEGLADGGVACLRFNFPYVSAGRRAPDRPPLLLDAWRRAVDAATQLAEGLPLVLSGKSLGGRMASLVLADDDAPDAAGLVFFGYPLHAPGRPERVRDAHLASVRVPMLFIQGTTDALARIDLVRQVVERLGDRARLHVVEGADHSFRVRGARRDPRGVGQELGTVAAAFVAEVAG